MTIFNILPSDLSFIHFFPRVSEKFIVPFKTISITASNALVDNLSVGLIKFPAALFNKQSILPNFLKESVITFSTSSIFLTSHAIGNTSDLYLELNSFATSFNNSSLLLVIITLAPNSKKYSTIDLPSPEPPPVTRITLSFRLFSLSIPLIK